MFASEVAEGSDLVDDTVLLEVGLLEIVVSTGCWLRVLVGEGSGGGVGSGLLIVVGSGVLVDAGPAELDAGGLGEGSDGGGEGSLNQIFRSWH